MVTGVKGFSENIGADGIIDRYLEHSRLFVFSAKGKMKTFIGSADWMPRNLDHRVEVVAPVLDPEMKADVMRTIKAGLDDNSNAFIVDGSGKERVLARDCCALPFAGKALFTIYRNGKIMKKQDIRGDRHRQQCRKASYKDRRPAGDGCFRHP